MLVASAVMCLLCALFLDPLRNYFFGPQRDVPAEFDFTTGKNVLWKSFVGSTAYGSPVVADNKVYVGTNNSRGFLARYPSSIDLGVLLCFDTTDGKLLWQASSHKYPRRTYDYPGNGIGGTPLIEGDRLWYITNRSELVCLDTEGFYDKEDDGIAASENLNDRAQEADVVWRLDMIGELGITPFDSCFNIRKNSLCLSDNTIYAVTGTSMIEDGFKHRNPQAPSFIAVDKHTGKLLWSDATPSAHVMNVQNGTPVCAKLGGITQVIFPGGDGWLYSFETTGTPDGKGKLLWRFDCNPKDSNWDLGSKNVRNSLPSAVTIANDRVYVAMGRWAHDGDGPGRIWCIDPTKRGDVSPDLVFNQASPNQPIDNKTPIACDKAAGDFTRPNPESAAIWLYAGEDTNRNGKRTIEEEMHRTVSRLVIHEDLLFASDATGIFRCLNANTGTMHWSYDMFAVSTSAPVVSESHVFATNEDGQVLVFGLSKNPQIAMPNGNPVHRIHSPSSIGATPTIDNDVLYILAEHSLYAIAKPRAK
ncbi:MAG: PQQ-binding-like beta-propeller repeat protein [Planctomycetota bacterium]